MQQHEERVRRIAAEVKARAAARRASGGGSDGPGFASLGKASVSHMVPNPGDPRHRDRKVDVRDLREILDLDLAGRTCTAEPGLTFSDLVRATLPYGLAPTLVPELKTITIGGAVSGCSVESMSYRYGGFHDGCLEYEIVTGTAPSQDVDQPLFAAETVGGVGETTFRVGPLEPGEYYFQDEEWRFLYNPTVGAAYQVMPSLFLGLEYWARGRFDDSGSSTAASDGENVSGPHHYAGPTVMVQNIKGFASLGAYVRWDDLGQGAKPDDPWGKVWVRVLFGVDL